MNLKTLTKLKEKATKDMLKALSAKKPDYEKIQAINTRWHKWDGMIKDRQKK